MLLTELAIVIDLRKRIVSDPEILRGKPCVRGTRVSVAFVLYLLAGGTKEEDIVKHYPHLTPEDIRACFLYASENLPGGNHQWKFEGSFLDGDAWTLDEGEEAPTLESRFRHG